MVVVGLVRSIGAVEFACIVVKMLLDEVSATSTVSGNLYHSVSNVK